MTFFRFLRAAAFIVKRRLILLALLGFTLTGANIFYWFGTWQSRNIMLCTADFFMACAQPSFQFMLLVPLCCWFLNSCQVFYAPALLTKLYTRRGQIEAMLLVLAFLCVLTVAFAQVLCCIVLNGILFGGKFTFNWQEPMSRFWAATGRTLAGRTTLGTVVLFQILSCFLLLLAFAVLFFLVYFAFRNARFGRITAWTVCLGSAWMFSFPISPAFYRLGRTVSFTAEKAEPSAALPYLFAGLAAFGIGSCLLALQLGKKDFL